MPLDGEQPLLCGQEAVSAEQGGMLEMHQPEDLEKRLLQVRAPRRPSTRLTLDFQIGSEATRTRFPVTIHINPH